MKMKKLVALGAAAAMSMTMCVNVFAESEVKNAVDAGYAGAKASYTGTFKDKEGNTLVAAEGTQMTVAVLKAIAQNADLENEDIEYINQDVADSALYTNMGTKDDLLATDKDGNAIYAGDYVIRVGFYDAKGAWHLAEGTFTIATKQASTETEIVNFRWGDVNASGIVDIDDAMALVYYQLGYSDTTESGGSDNRKTYKTPDGQYTYMINNSYGTELVLWGDVNASGNVDIDDAMALVYYQLGYSDTTESGGSDNRKVYTNSNGDEYKINDEHSYTLSK